MKSEVQKKAKENSKYTQTDNQIKPNNKNKTIDQAGKEKLGGNAKAREQRTLGEPQTPSAATTIVH